LEPLGNEGLEIKPFTLLSPLKNWFKIPKAQWKYISKKLKKMKDTIPPTHQENNAFWNFPNWNKFPRSLNSYSNKRSFHRFKERRTSKEKNLFGI